MSDAVKVALIVALPLILAQVAVIYGTYQTHKLVNSKMTAALTQITALEGEIRGLRSAPDASARAQVPVTPAPIAKLGE